VSQEITGFYQKMRNPFTSVEKTDLEYKMANEEVSPAKRETGVIFNGIWNNGGV
jgi:hypothetical protein